MANGPQENLERLRRDDQDARLCGSHCPLYPHFFYEPFSIPSASMVPTLLVGDYLFVSKFSYGYSRCSLPFGLPLIPGRAVFFRAPHRGDVVVFKLTCAFSS